MKRFLSVVLLVLMMASITACGAKPEEPEKMPEDFEFFLRWNTYGISSYDSATGKLVKTTDATKPEDYVTELKLTDEQMQKAWEIISALDMSKYPAEYNPNVGELSTPSFTLELKIKSGDKEQTVLCKDIAHSFVSKDKDGQAFLTACKDLVKLITETEQWKSLPEYEFFYD